MKKLYVGVLIWSFALAPIRTVSPCAQGSSKLEDRIKQILLYQPDVGEDYDIRTKITELGREIEVRQVLISFLSAYRYPENTMEELFLDGAVFMLGELKAKEAQGALSQILLDSTADRRTRAWAAKSLGQIDVDANKDVLLEALRPRQYHLIRINAADALANTKDPKVLTALDRYSREERENYVRQRLQKATDKLRARLKLYEK